MLKKRINPPLTNISYRILIKERFFTNIRNKKSIGKRMDVSKERQWQWLPE